jgi:ectoine hydroxylase-related dioxygenase (phytanoyl-CoA dioxygenase family)
LLEVYNLGHDPLVIDFLKREFSFGNIVVTGGQVVHIISSRLKIPDGYFGLGTHQDFHSGQGSLDGLVLWVPLVNVDRNMFPVEVIPGSHKKGPLPQVELETGWILQPEYYNESDFIPVECEVGDIVILNNFIVHRSSPKGDDRLRLAFSTRFDNGTENTYIERCYPTGYKRIVHRKQLHDVCVYFN